MLLCHRQISSGFVLNGFTPPKTHRDNWLDGNCVWLTQYGALSFFHQWQKTVKEINSSNFRQKTIQRTPGWSIALKIRILLGTEISEEGKKLRDSQSFLMKYYFRNRTFLLAMGADNWHVFGTCWYCSWSSISLEKNCPTVWKNLLPYNFFLLSYSSKSRNTISWFNFIPKAKLNLYLRFL